ncbi:hypothetical protein TKK_0003051 [Trichogramma kaykai]
MLSWIVGGDSPGIRPGLMATAMMHRSTDEGGEGAVTTREFTVEWIGLIRLDDPIRGRVVGVYGILCRIRANRGGPEGVATPEATLAETPLTTPGSLGTPPEGGGVTACPWCIKSRACSHPVSSKPLDGSEKSDLQRKNPTATKSSSQRPPGSPQHRKSVSPSRIRTRISRTPSTNFTTELYK